MVDRRNWHVTLAFIGPCPENRIPYRLERADELRVEPFRLYFDRLEYWPRPRVASLSAATQRCRDHVRFKRSVASP